MQQLFWKPFSMLWNTIFSYFLLFCGTPQEVHFDPNLCVAPSRGLNQHQCGQMGRGWSQAKKRIKPQIINIWKKSWNYLKEWQIRLIVSGKPLKLLNTFPQKCMVAKSKSAAFSQNYFTMKGNCESSLSLLFSPEKQAIFWMFLFIWRLHEVVSTHMWFEQSFSWSCLSNTANYRKLSVTCLKPHAKLLPLIIANVGVNGVIYLPSSW